MLPTRTEAFLVLLLNLHLKEFIHFSYSAMLASLIHIRKRLFVDDIGPVVPVGCVLVDGDETVDWTTFKDFPVICLTSAKYLVTEVHRNGY